MNDDDDDGGNRLRAAIDSCRAPAWWSAVAALSCVLRTRDEAVARASLAEAVTQALAQPIDDWLTVGIVHETVRACMRAGAVDDAAALASYVEVAAAEAPPIVRYRAAEANSAAQRFRQANNLAQCGADRSRAHALLDIAVAACEAHTAEGDSWAPSAFAAAIAAARAVDDERDRGWTLRDVAVGLLRAGERYRQQLRTVVDEAADVAAGERSMTIQLAVLYAEAGNAKRARAALKRIKLPGDRAAVALGVANALARQPDADDDARADVERAIHELCKVVAEDKKVRKDPRECARYLGDAADAFAAIGDRAASRTAFRDAARALGDVEDPANALLHWTWLIERPSACDDDGKLHDDARECLAAGLAAMRASHDVAEGDPGTKPLSEYGSPRYQHVYHSCDFASAASRAGENDVAARVVAESTVLAAGWRGPPDDDDRNVGNRIAWSLSRWR